MSKKRKRKQSKNECMPMGMSMREMNKPRMDVHMSHTITDKNQMAKILLGVDKKKGK